MMVIRQDLVKGKPAQHFPKDPVPDQEGCAPPHGKWRHGQSRAGLAEKGKQFFEMAVEGVMGALDELESDPGRSEATSLFFFIIFFFINGRFWGYSTGL